MMKKIIYSFLSMVVFYSGQSYADKKSCTVLADTEQQFLTDFCKANPETAKHAGMKGVCDENELTRSSARQELVIGEKQKTMNWGSTSFEILTTCTKKNKLKITKFIARGLKVKVMPSSIVNLSELKHLYLTGNQIREIPSNLDKLSLLETIGLTNNQIQEIPKNLTKLSELVLLGLSNNQITELPSGIGKLSKLMVLELDNNRISKLPNAVGRLSKLSWLGLANNQLTELPNSLGKLPKLEQLYLSGNRINKVPVWLKEFAPAKGLDKQVID